MKNNLVYMVSLGCPKNRVDSEIMLGDLFKNGYKLSNNPEEADTLIVNTCGFLEESKIESLEVIMELAKLRSENKKLIVAGCLAQRYKEELNNDLLEADYIVGVEEFDNISKIINSDKRLNANRTSYLQDYRTPRINTLPFYMAYIKIAEGCSNNCSFCIIPKIRGNQRSRKIEDIVLEAKFLAAKGVKELNLIAQELTAYGEDIYGCAKLYELLKELIKIDKIKWIRLFYNYPAGFSDKLIELIANEEKIVNYIDLPLQHISDNILKKMFRAGREKMIRELIYKLKFKIPNVSLRSSFIVGFPGESKEDFKKLHKFIKESEFEHLGVFQYSPEEGTKAALMDKQISEKLKEERWNLLMSTQQKISQKIMNSYIGKNLEVLVDGISEESEFLLSARHRTQAYSIDGITYINAGSAQAGDLVKLKITQASEYDLLGHIIT